jgi:hypothetical protein
VIARQPSIPMEPQTWSMSVLCVDTQNMSGAVARFARHLQREPRELDGATTFTLDDGRFTVMDGTHLSTMMPPEPSDPAPRLAAFAVRVADEELCCRIFMAAACRRVAWPRVSPTSRPGARPRVGARAAAAM